MLVSLAILASAKVVELFPSGNSLAFFAPFCLFISSYRSVSSAQLISTMAPAFCMMLVAVLTSLVMDLYLVFFQFRMRMPTVDLLSLNASQVTRVATSSPNKYKCRSRLLTGPFKHTGC